MSSPVLVTYSPSPSAPVVYYGPRPISTKYYPSVAGQVFGIIIVLLIIAAVIVLIWGFSTCACGVISCGSGFFANCSGVQCCN
jgi:hypothetical protein